VSYLFQEKEKGNKKSLELRFTICVSGAAAGETVEKSADLAEQIGREIAKKGHILTTGATVGLPFYAARGASLAGGMSIGFSPAASLREHVRKYRLPYQYFDFINFTGMEYVGRDLYLVQSSDALITVGGRFGSLHEFTSALEARKPCGILLGSGGTADIVPTLMDMLEPPNRKLIIYDDNPERLVGRIAEVLREEYKEIRQQFRKNEFWFLDHPHPRRG
jgi:uncharacterized protein (TIGR00725 family)